MNDVESNVRTPGSGVAVVLHQRVQEDARAEAVVDARGRQLRYVGDAGQIDVVDLQVQ